MFTYIVVIMIDTDMFPALQYIHFKLTTLDSISNIKTNKLTQMSKTKCPLLYIQHQS